MRADCPSIVLYVSIWGCRYGHWGPSLQFFPNLHPVFLGVVSRLNVGSILHFGSAVSVRFSKGSIGKFVMYLIYSSGNISHSNGCSAVHTFGV